MPAGFGHVALAATMGGRVLYESFEALLAHAVDGVAHAAILRSVPTRRSTVADVTRYNPGREAEDGFVHGFVLFLYRSSACISWAESGPLG